MTKFTLAIMAAALIVLTFNSSMVVHAQLSSSALIRRTSYTQDRASSRQGEDCYADNEEDHRQALSVATAARGDTARNQASAPQTVNNEDATTLGIEKLKNSCEEAIAFLKENERRARNELNGNVKNMFLSDAADLENFVNRFTRVVAGMEYGAMFNDAYKAHKGDMPERQKYQLELATHQAAKNAGKYAFAKATVREGLKTVVVQMFPRTAPLLNEQVVTIASSTLVNVTSFLDGSESKAADPSKIIRDNSGTFSIDEKRQALYREWNRFDQNDSSWDRRMARNLVDETEIVYVQSIQPPRGKSRPIQ